MDFLQKNAIKNRENGANYKKIKEEKGKIMKTKYKEKKRQEDIARSKRDR